MRVIVLLIVALADLRAFAANRFVELGAPAPDREWSGRDYVDFADVLQSGRFKGLPKVTEPEGREILERVVNVENFGMIRNELLPLVQRMQYCGELSKGLNDVVLAYVREANRGGKVSRELAMLLAMTLRSTAVMLELVEVQMRESVADEQAGKLRTRGYEQVKSGLATVVAGAETTLGERTYYTEDDLVILLEALAETLPAIAPTLTANFRAELLRKFERHKRTFTTASARKHLTSIEDALMLKALQRQP